MSQEALAGLSGLSQGYISQIESGRRQLDRKATQVAIAAALNITVAQLLGQPNEATDPTRVRALLHVPTIRSTLVELSTGERRRPGRDKEALRQAVREMTDLRNSASYAELTPSLSALLFDLAGHGNDLAPELVETLFCARYVLKSIGQPDLALKAAEMGMTAAQSYDSPAWLGQATYSWIQAFPPENADLACRLVRRAADDLQALPDHDTRQVYGCLHIMSAFQAAIALSADDAAAHLAEAEAVSRSLGEPARYSLLSAGFNGNWFGPTQVEYWRVAIAAELGDAAAAIAVTQRIDLSAVPVPNRLVYYWTDLARALASVCRDDEAKDALVNAERAAPEHFRFNPVVRDLVATLINRAKRRAVEGSLLSLAQNLCIDTAV